MLNLNTQNFSHFVQKRTFSDSGFNDGAGGGKKFNEKNGHISETVRDTANLTMTTNRKWHIGFEIYMKIINFR